MPFLPPNQQCQSTEGMSTEGMFFSHAVKAAIYKKKQNNVMAVRSHKIKQHIFDLLLSSSD